MLRTKTAKMILGCAVALLFVSVLFPPWMVFTNVGGGVTELPYSYSFLFTTPIPVEANIDIKISFRSLFTEWFVLLLGATIALLLERLRDEG